MKYRYVCYHCGNEETIKYPQGEVTCPLCGQVMVFVETIWRTALGQGRILASLRHLLARAAFV